VRALLVGATAVVLVVGGIIVGYRLSSSPVLAPILPSKCTVGYAGTHLQVTVEGIGAVATCDRAVQVSTSWYRIDAVASGALVCRQTVGHLTYTVWDEGILMLMGNSECRSLQSQGLTAPAVTSRVENESPSVPVEMT
jgi:hypothetical protein